MIARFQVEHIITIKNKVYVFCKYLTRDTKYYLSNSSYLGAYPIEKWIDMPRALDNNGNQRMDLFSFVLKNADDKEKININDIHEMWDDYVDVKESYALSSIGKMVAFLKCYPGKYDEEYILEDNSKKKWALKKYMIIFGSLGTYEKISGQESENIFQYWIQPIGHEEKPIVGDKLRIYKNNK